MIVLSFTNCVYGQELFKDETFGFQIEEPKKWFEATNQDLINNLSKFELSDKSHSKMLSDHNGSIMLISYYKYDPKKYDGLIPTIQINVRSKQNNNFQEFKNDIINSSNGFKKHFPDFKFIVEPSELDINGTKSVYFIGEFTMKTQYGELLKVRSRTYAIPQKDYFFQLNFTDSSEKKLDCSHLFDELVRSVKVYNKQIE